MDAGLLVAANAWPIGADRFLALGKFTHREPSGDIRLTLAGDPVYYFAEVATWPVCPDERLALAATLDWKGPYNPRAFNRKLVELYFDDDIILAHPEINFL